MKGHIAQRYGELLKDIWSGSAKTTAPIKLRVSIGVGKGWGRGGVGWGCVGREGLFWMKGHVAKRY